MTFALSSPQSYIVYRIRLDNLDDTRHHSWCIASVAFTSPSLVLLNRGRGQGESLGINELRFQPDNCVIMRVCGMWRDKGNMERNAYDKMAILLRYTVRAP